MADEGSVVARCLAEARLEAARAARRVTEAVDTVNFYANAEEGARRRLDIAKSAQLHADGHVVMLEERLADEQRLAAAENWKKEHPDV